MKRNILEHRRWRLVVFLLVIGTASVFFQFVIEAPINLPDSFLALPFMFLWQPVIGLPYVVFSFWWIFNKRLPLLVLIIPITLTAFCARLIVGSPPSLSDEERNEIRESLGEEFLERHDRNRPGYKRKLFPPYWK